MKADDSDKHTGSQTDKPNDKQNDKLWELLGKTRSREVSPFFARNVLRAVRAEEDARPPVSLLSRCARLTRLPRFSCFSRFSQLTRSLRLWTWRGALAGTCAVAAVAAVTTLAPGFPSAFVRHHHPADVQMGQLGQLGKTRQIVTNPDYEVIKHLDELVADEESSLWLDDSVH